MVICPTKILAEAAARDVMSSLVLDKYAFYSFLFLSGYLKLQTYVRVHSNFPPSSNAAYNILVLFSHVNQTFLGQKNNHKIEYLFSLLTRSIMQLKQIWSCGGEKDTKNYNDKHTRTNRTMRINAPAKLRDGVLHGRQGKEGVGERRIFSRFLIKTTTEITSLLEWFIFMVTTMKWPVMFIQQSPKFRSAYCCFRFLESSTGFRRDPDEENFISHNPSCPRSLSLLQPCRREVRKNHSSISIHQMFPVCHRMILCSCCVADQLY